MIELTFITGGAMRTVFVEGRSISLLTAELGNTPLTIDLDKLEDKETREKIKEAKLDSKDLEQLSNLRTEEEIAKDVTKDFQKSGWRLFKKE